MFRDAKPYGIPRLTRREMFVALLGVAATPTKATTEPVGFYVSGTLTATELERQEGYATLGSELMIATHPKSPIYQNLVGMIGSEVRFSLEPK